MNAGDTQVTAPSYSEEDHNTWHRLCLQQLQMIEEIACDAYREGFAAIALDLTRVPDRATVSARLERLTGWQLFDAENEYLNATEWFEHLAEYRFPVTSYIRGPHELDFTPLPDLFHEYFGHLPFFATQLFADVSHRFGEVYRTTRTETQQLAIARLWWFSMEFGFIRQRGELRPVGASFYSSRGEYLHAMQPDTPLYPFEINRVAATPASKGYHDQYFVLDSIQQLCSLIDDYAYQEGLAAPVSSLC